MLEYHIVVSKWIRLKLACQGTQAVSNEKKYLITKDIVYIYIGMMEPSSRRYEIY